MGAYPFRAAEGDHRTKDHGDEKVLTTTEARQGVRAGVLQVLVYSLLLAVLAGVGLALWTHFGGHLR